MNSNEILAFLSRLPTGTIVNVNVVLVVDQSAPLPDPVPDPVPDPKPEPAPIIKYVKAIKEEGKVNAFMQRGVNAKGIPIIDTIYPSNSSPVTQRIQFSFGDLIPVWPSIVKADGGSEFYKIYDPVKKMATVDLYVNLSHVALE